ncbi:GTP-dependent dephospho-CoA kinase family protein [Natronomonas gomsonensis]|uniref:GTP-dependent dephospho-CoA kinase family protein n=1 Tax=Natronomonas gomsonensis TaxID=1046043 RepID=UPI0015BCF8BC|nr:GTP-dependent dephospho-CoA kinase family protein [Natronomonas gomsonensis]
MVEVLVELQTELRGELKDPLGPIYTDTDALLADTDGPIIAVGDIVTYHLLEAGRRPDVALVDGKTKRERVEREILDAIEGFDHQQEVENPPATLTAELLEALDDAIDSEGTTVITVVGEEDLAALPAIVAAPDGAAVVYGQPDEGMVLVTVDETLRTECRGLLERMEGDSERLFDILGV